VSVFAVVPVKNLAEAKSRLSASLDLEERGVLTLTLLKNVLAALRGVGSIDRVAVVSPSRRALSLAEEVDATALLQESRGLNEALEEGRRWALDKGASALLVLPADLPYLSASDVQMLLEALNDTAVSAVISPDRLREGTNALLLRPPDALQFVFGPGSFEAHLRGARERGIQVEIRETVGVAFDVDTREDLRSLREPRVPRR
jgi:2-phospho-L-lactate guanylyltransferase